MVGGHQALDVAHVYHGAKCAGNHQDRNRSQRRVGETVDESGSCLRKLPAGGLTPQYGQGAG